LLAEPMKVSCGSPGFCKLQCEYHGSIPFFPNLRSHVLCVLLVVFGGFYWM